VIIYIVKDPYCDFGWKDHYRFNQYFHIPGDMSVKRLENEKRNDNTFIFGSSRAVPLYACYVKYKIFNNSNNVKPFHFSTWSESIGGIYSKMNYLNQRGIVIKNCILLIDNKNTFLNHGKIKQNNHYLLTGKSKSYTIIDHFIHFFYYSGKRLPENIEILFGLKKKNDINFADLETNDLFHTCSLYNRKHVFDTTLFYKSIPINHEKPNFYPINKQDKRTKNQIFINELTYLKKIKNIFIKNKTNYVILIAPMYNQKKFSVKDEKIINAIFDKRVIDFSGVNSITQNIDNYSSISHYYPYIGKIMIDSLSKSNLLNK
jgi:hypothetical protein